MCPLTLPLSVVLLGVFLQQVKSRHLNLFLPDSKALAHCSFMSNLVSLLTEPPYLPGSFLPLFFVQPSPLPQVTPLSTFCTSFATVVSAASGSSSLTNLQLLTAQITQVVFIHMPSAPSVAYNNCRYISSISLPSERIFFFPSRPCIDFSCSTSCNIGKTQFFVHIQKMYMNIHKTLVCFYRKYSNMIVGDI